MASGTRKTRSRSVEGVARRKELNTLPHNPFAKALSWRRFQHKIVKSGKVYKRMRKSEINTEKES